MKLRTALLILVFAFAGGFTLRLEPDWGDDWAQYQEQALWLKQGDYHRPVVRFLYDPSAALYAPPLYPWGWPVILSTLPTLNALPYLMLLVYVTWGISLYFFILNKTNDANLSAAWAAVWALTPYLLRFKWEGLSDLPFALVVLAYFLWDTRWGSHRWGRWGGAFWIASAIFIRPLGWALVLGAILESTFRKKENRTLHAPWAVALCGGLLALGGQSLFPHVSGHSVRVYAYPWSVEGLLDRGLYYLTQWKEVWSVVHSWRPGWGAWGGHWAFGWAIGSAVYGALARPSQGKAVGWGFVLFYAGALLLFPNQTQGFRYLVPLIPWMVPQNIPRRASLLTATILLLLFLPAWIRVREESKLPGIGPHTPAAQALFEEIDRRIPPHDTLIATRPRVLSYLTGRYSLHAESNTAKIPRVAEHRWWVASRHWPPSEVPPTAKKVWSNEDFALFSFETLNSRKVH